MGLQKVAGGVRTSVLPPHWTSGKASSSRTAELGSIPAFTVKLFFRSSPTSDFKIDTPEAVLSGAWCYRVSAETGWCSVSIL